MLHAYFRPGGEVLFAPFDPQVSCPARLGHRGRGRLGRRAALRTARNPAIPLVLLTGLMVVAWLTFRHRLAARH